LDFGAAIGFRRIGAFCLSAAKPLAMAQRQRRYRPKSS
jgi:hypothetical protein